jgi:hypothetical protein
MTRLHRLVPTITATVAAAALLAPAAQARPAVSGGASGGGSVAVERTVHDQPLANPVSVPPQGLNHGAGITLVHGRTTQIGSSTDTNWVDVFSGAAASAIVIAMCAAGVGIGRRRTLTA